MRTLAIYILNEMRTLYSWDGVLGEEKETIDIYFDELSLLITDNSTFYFNLHTLDDNN